MSIDAVPPRPRKWLAGTLIALILLPFAGLLAYGVRQARLAARRSADI